MLKTVLIASVLGLGGCASIGPVTDRNGRDRIAEHREFCKREINTNDYLDCLGGEQKSDSVGVGVSWPAKDRKEPAPKYLKLAGT